MKRPFRVLGNLAAVAAAGVLCGLQTQCGSSGSGGGGGGGGRSEAGPTGGSAGTGATGGTSSGGSAGTSSGGSAGTSSGGSAGTSSGGSAGATSFSGPCGSTAAPPAHYKHVVIFAFENRTWSDVGMGFSNMPYLHSLATKCTYFADWTETNTSQDSLTQYIGETSGVDNPNTVNDCTPSSSCRSTDNNIFRQVRVAGGTARNFVDGASSGCSSSGNDISHIPDLYYYGTYTDPTSHATVGDHSFCNQEVRPLSEFDPNNPPTYAFITPDQCNDGHSCGDATADAWAKVHVQAVLDGAAYKSGNTAVFIFYDEDHPVPNLQIAPTSHKGQITVTGVGSHAALLKTIEDMLGLPILSQGQLANATDLRSLIGI